MGAIGERGVRAPAGAVARTAGAWLVAASLVVSGGIVAMVLARQAPSARPAAPAAPAVGTVPLVHSGSIRIPNVR